MPSKHPETIDCDTCKTTYAARRTNATAHVFLTAPECNYLATKCTSCGAHETVYLKPPTMSRAIEGGALRVWVDPEPNDERRKRAAAAWARAETPDTPAPAPEVTLKTYDLTPRQEAEVEAFARVLGTLPTALIHDELDPDLTHRPYPDRWID